MMPFKFIHKPVIRQIATNQCEIKIGIIFIDVIAYPSNEDNKTLLNALPTVKPYPGSNGRNSKLPWLASSFIITTYHISNSLEWNFHWSVNLLVVFWNRLNVWVPSIFSANFPQSLLCQWQWLVGSPTCCRFLPTKSLSEGCVSITYRFCSWWVGNLFPFTWWWSQKWNTVGLMEWLSIDIVTVDLIFIRDISVKDEWSGI